jgi:hypothetical protein
MRSKCETQYSCLNHQLGNVETYISDLVVLHNNFPRDSVAGLFFAMSCGEERGPNFYLYTSTVLLGHVSQKDKTGWRFDDVSKSSVTILGGSLQPNRTYQFMVQMTDRQNSSLPINGYLIVQIQEISCPIIVIS